MKLQKRFEGVNYGHNGSDITYLNFGQGGIVLHDEDLAELEKYPQLEDLFLGGSSITDAGLGHLKKLTHLRCLFIDNTRISAKGMKELQDALPKTLIH